MKLGLVAAKGGDADLGRGWSRKAFHAGDENAVLLQLGHDNTLELGSDIGAIVQGTLNLVQELRRDCTDRDLIKWSANQMAMSHNFVLTSPPVRASLPRMQEPSELISAMGKPRFSQPSIKFLNPEK